MKPDIHKLNRFTIRVGRIHIGHKELSGSSMDYRKAGLALIEQGISDTLCSLDPDLIPWNILDQVEVFFSVPGSTHPRKQTTTCLTYDVLIDVLKRLKISQLKTLRISAWPSTDHCPVPTQWAVWCLRQDCLAMACFDGQCDKDRKRIGSFTYSD